MNHIPTAIGLVLCDQIIVEEGTHNVTPVNCFNARVLDTFPGRTTFFVLAWLASGMGEMAAEVVVQRLDTLDEVYRDQGKLVFSDRLHDARFIARVRGCPFPVSGYYEVSLIIDHELIAHRRFRVQKKGADK